MEIWDQQLHIYGMERLTGNAPDISSVEDTVVTQSHRDVQGKSLLIVPRAPQWRREADPLAASDFQVTWMSSTDPIFPCVLCSDADTCTDNSENIAMTSSCSYYCFSEWDYALLWSPAGNETPCLIQFFHFSCKNIDQTFLGIGGFERKDPTAGFLNRII